MTPFPKLALKYLFAAQMEDGSVVIQSAEDVSPLDPSRNAYYDLLQHQADGSVIPHPKDGMATPGTDIVQFALSGPDGVTYGVDLRTGEFSIGGIRFWVGEPPMRGEKRMLVYFRRRREHIRVTVDNETAEVIRKEPAGSECEYHFGWTSPDKEKSAVVVLV